MSGTITVGLLSGFGVAVGDVVGTAVGDTVGDAVGTAVGDAVGAAVGDAVGDVAGTAVGDAVGTAVGDVVGAAVGGIKITKVIRPMIPFFIAMIVTLLLVTFIPEITLWLPNALGLMK